MSTFASTAMPMVSASPQIPGSVIEAPNIASTATWSSRLKTTAMLLMTADLFANRETVVTGTGAQKVPTSMQVDALLANYRIWL